MKTPFSPWLPYVVMIAACFALAAFVGFERHVGWRSPLAGDALPTPGIVRALYDEPVDGEPKTRATVKLFDGSTVDGYLAPGCLVFIGDRVVVADVGPGTTSEAHLVFPETPR